MSVNGKWMVRQLAKCRASLGALLVALGTPQVALAEWSHPFAAGDKSRATIFCGSARLKNQTEMLVLCLFGNKIAACRGTRLFVRR